ncbi:multicopper oxidase family protein [Micromonospora sp. NBRC 101691]|uniref:multicopper oxidase family protein n=1 Tax=Micromonospora sp. NBRC 101691 TaxID=3032198 RepID=UPI0024A517AF|nr:multicopper oxidase family protein [Micromonospora sp. NBRC 101691]GLY23942.1 hypothetical protein Misp04_36740 [Micromonospora sp. NBRC 101691]
MLFESYLNYDIEAALFLTLLWGTSAVLVARRPRHRSDRRGRRRATFMLVLVALGWLGVAARVVTTLLMGSFGYLFVADRVAVALPLVILPALAVLVLAVPRWRAHRRNPSAETRLATFAPQAVVPFQATALGALAGFVTAIMVTMGPPQLIPILTVYVSFLTILVGLWLWQQHRYLVAERGGPVQRTRPVRALRAVAVATGFVLLLVGGLSLAANETVLPGRMNMTDHAHGGVSAAGAHGHSAGRTVSVADLTGPRSETPDRRFTLVAEAKKLRLASGREVDAWLFNGQSPGPELRVKRGELIEVTVHNKVPDTNVSVHWHGVDVPNAEDGVAGVTQNAIQPGGTHVYRFRPDEVGTHWYHSHQQSSVQVKKGLFGPLIIEPEQSDLAPGTQDLIISTHTWYEDELPLEPPAIGTVDQLDRRRTTPGTPVRLRLINTDGATHRYSLTGTPFTVVAIDGNPINEPTEVADRQIVIGGGGRYDLEFTMPAQPVRLTELRRFGKELRVVDGGLLLSADGTGDVRPDKPQEAFDPTTYGSPLPTPFGRDSKFTKTHSLVFDNELWFYDGKFTVVWASNGMAFPKAPSLTVREGDLVKVRFANRSHFDHPMHLHGHHVLVLSRNGKPATGSPLWLDTVNVEVGEIWEVAFKADNPGLWMDHCHNLDHAAAGMMSHVIYEGVTTPYEVGHDTPNKLE